MGSPDEEFRPIYLLTLNIFEQFKNIYWFQKQLCFSINYINKNECFKNFVVELSFENRSQISNLSFLEDY